MVSKTILRTLKRFYQELLECEANLAGVSHDINSEEYYALIRSVVEDKFESYLANNDTMNVNSNQIASFVIVLIDREHAKRLGTTRQKRLSRYYYDCLLKYS